jgi:hypothetical protein
MLILLTAFALATQAQAEEKLWPTTIECTFDETIIDTDASTMSEARLRAEIPVLIEAQYSSETAVSAFGKATVVFPKSGTVGEVHVLFTNKLADGSPSKEKSLFVSFHYKIDGQFTGSFSQVEKAQSTSSGMSNINMMRSPYLLQIFEYAETLPKDKKQDQLAVYREVFPGKKLVPISYDVNCSASPIPKFKVGDKF